MSHHKCKEVEMEIEGEYKRDLTLGEKLDKLTRHMENSEPAPEKKISKKFRLPFRARLSKARLNKGYATVIEIGENNAINFRREQIIDATIKLDNTYHSVTSDDCLSYKGKPAVIIPRKSKVPYNPNNTKNTTFSQKHIMSRMMNETLDTKKKLGGLGMSIGAIILLAVLGYAFIAG